MVVGKEEDLAVLVVLVVVVGGGIGITHIQNLLRHRLQVVLLLRSRRRLHLWLP